MSNSSVMAQLALLIGYIPTTGFIRTDCLQRLQNLTSANPSLLNNPLIFYRDPVTGLLQNDASILTLPACQAICGTGTFSLYPDAISRLLTWIVPTVLLVTNMQYAPIGLARFAMVPHLLGDPVDSIYSLLTKVETRNRCFAMAVAMNEKSPTNQEQKAQDHQRTKDAGLIISCIEEMFAYMNRERDTDIEAPYGVNGPTSITHRKNFRSLRGEVKPMSSEIQVSRDTTAQDNEIEMLKVPVSTATEVADQKIGFQEQLEIHQHKPRRQHFTMDSTPFCHCKHPALDKLYRETALSIHDSRNSGIHSTIFGIGVYIVLGVLAAFIPAFGGNPNPSGGKIATSILLVWLLPEILLSNIVGSFNTSRTCLKILQELRNDLQRMLREDVVVHGPRCGGQRAIDWIREMDKQEWRAYMREMPENGSIYSFRLMKCFPQLSTRTGRRNYYFTTTHPIHGHWQLIILSVLPVCTAFIASFIVLWSSPTYFNCRHIMVLCIFISWILSAIFTALVSRTGVTPRWQFGIILIKDVLLASTILSLLVSSASGLFNSCFCWSGWWYLDRWTSEPQVQLDTTGQFDQNVKWVYPLVVGLTLGAQLLWFSMMLWVGRKVYFRMAWRDDKWLWRVALAKDGEPRIRTDR